MIVLAGTYSTTGFTCTTNGTSSSPVIIEAQNAAVLNIGETNHSIINYTGSNGTEAIIVQINSSYTSFIGFEITGTSGSVGIMNEGSYNLMKWNQVHDLGANVACNDDGGAGIDDGNYSAGYNTMDSNVVYNITASSSSCNYFHGLYELGAHSLLENNLISNTQALAVTLYHGAYNATVVNNTIYNYGNPSNGDGIDVSADCSTFPADNYTLVANNIVYGGQDGTGIEEDSTCSGAQTYAVNNISYDNAGSNNYSWPNGTQTGDLSVAPGFANYVATGGGPISDYAAASSSSAMVGAGISNTTAATYNKVSGQVAGSVPNHDILGNPRPNPTTGAWDIGAFQYQ